MLRHHSQFKGYAIHASDGFIGTVSDLLFDDTTWLVRWLVVDTGVWLSGRRVLLPPSAIAHVNHIGHQFSVRLTKQQIKDCPDIESDRIVSRLSEAGIYEHYGWAPYWSAGSYLGMVGYRGSMEGATVTAWPSPNLIQRERGTDDEQRKRADPALRSIEEVKGCQFHASDGEIGHITDFLVEDNDWSIHCLVVDDRALEQARYANKLLALREAAANHVAALTVRQYQIMEMVLAGHPSKNIATDLHISQRTVENHRAAIMKKTGAKSLPALARLALVAAGNDTETRAWTN